MPEAAARAAASRWPARREEAELYAKQILGMTLVTHQTGPQGQKVQRLLIEETACIDRELYLGIVLDRVTGKLVFMASQAGGMEIEVVAAKTPEAIFKETIDPAIGFGAWQARKLAFALGLKPAQINAAVAFLQSLYKAFIETDASLVEINPFITTTDDKLFALDAKMTFDDNAIFRHPEIKALRDTAEEDPLEVEASKYSLNYIRLDGSIACMVNGAGLAMATMDIIQYAGGRPANFLDVGGGATQEQIEHAFEILLADAHVKAIFINIFGGILRVDRLATGVVAATRNLEGEGADCAAAGGHECGRRTQDSEGVGIEFSGWGNNERGRGVSRRRQQARSYFQWLF